jgi:hypothetical protein
LKTREARLMPTYEIIYAPNSAAERAGMETEIEATSYTTNSRFVTFYLERDDVYRPGEVLLTVAASQVLQVKTVKED